MNDTTTPDNGGSTRLPRDVVLLSWVSFFADVSSEMSYPLMPMFVVGVLGASPTMLGSIEGAAGLIVAIVSAWAGISSDMRRRRVPYIRAGYGLPVIGKTLTALAVAWPMVLAGRLVDRFGKGLRGSPRDALIADAAGPAIRGRAFGFHRAMDTAGAMVGVLLAAVLLWWLTGSPSNESATVQVDANQAIRVVLWVSAALGLISAALTLLVHEPVLASRTEPTETKTPSGYLGLPRSYWWAIAPLLMFAFANSSDAFLLLRAQNLGLSPWAVVLAYALFNLTYTVASYPAGIVSDRFGRRRVIAVGWSIYAMVYIGFVFTASPGVWPLLALYGVYMALTDGVGKAWVVDQAPPQQRGKALGVYYMFSGIATLLASVVGGLLWERIGPGATFGLGALGALLSILLLLLNRSFAQQCDPDRAQL